MKKQLVKLTMLAAVPALMIGVSSCTTGMGGVESENVAAMPGGVLIVDTLTLDAKVTARDLTNRKITLKSDDTGETKSFKVGPDMTNFDRIHAGDQVHAVVTDEIAVYIGVGAPPSETVSGGAMISPDGTAPNGIAVETSSVTAVVTSVDVKKRKVSLELPDGESKTVKVGKNVDLSQVVVGENLTVVIGEGLAVSVTAP
ncbi:hypothetical protein P4E94_08440 [Pontiellaceae bacterium B12219]|nr:hypothetical protein [Pontiellaceae bacterium B12219]